MQSTRKPRKKSSKKNVHWQSQTFAFKSREALGVSGGHRTNGPAAEFLETLPRGPRKRPTQNAVNVSQVDVHGRIRGVGAS